MSGLVATVIGNAVTIICCTIFSMHFNNPWLILVALLFYRSYSVETKGKGTTDGKQDE